LPSIVDALGPHLDVREWGDGDFVDSVSASDRKLLVVLSGCASVERPTQDGRAALLFLRKAGELIGADAFFAADQHALDVYSIGASSIGKISIRKLRKLMQGELAGVAQELRDALTADVVRSVGEVYDRVVYLSTCDVYQRVEGALQDLANLRGEPDPKGIRVDAPCRLLAIMTGAAQMSIRRAKRELIEDGKIIKGRDNEVVLLNH
jgi:CRP-like cAMP-binding protein